jgi:hypothetical protein
MLRQLLGCFLLERGTLVSQGRGKRGEIIKDFGKVFYVFEAILKGLGPGGQPNIRRGAARIVYLGRLCKNPKPSGRHTMGHWLENDKYNTQKEALPLLLNSPNWSANKILNACII